MEIGKKFLSKKLLYLIAGACLIAIGVLILIYRVSDANRVAVKAVFESDQVIVDFGRVRKIMLFSAAWKYSGQFACADFNYLIFAEKGAGIVKVRVVKRPNSQLQSWSAIDLARDSDEFRHACW